MIMMQLEKIKNTDNSNPLQTPLQPPLLHYSNMGSSVSEMLSEFINNSGANAESHLVGEHNQRIYSRLVQNPQATRNISNPALFQSCRLTGPIQFVRNLLKTWNLEQIDAVFLLGFEVSDRHHVDNLLNGYAPLVGRDIKDRIAYLFQIRGTLSILFQSKEVENEWLREKHTMLNDQKPLEMLLEGTMENLLLVKDYVNVAAGR